jgi:hypothetical protein
MCLGVRLPNELDQARARPSYGWDYRETTYG